jgi:hypothetical protein
MLFIVLLTVSCNGNNGAGTSKINDELIENTIKIEKLDHNLSNFLNTYDEYEKNITALSGNIDMDNNYQRKYIPDPINLREIKESELENIAKKYGRNSVVLKVSNVYDNRDIKYIYTMATVTPQMDHKLEDVLIITRRYVYVRDGENWMLSAVEMAYYDGEDSVEEMDNTKFENEPVKYEQELVLIDLNGFETNKSIDTNDYEMNSRERYIASLAVKNNLTYAGADSFEKTYLDKNGSEYEGVSIEYRSIDKLAGFIESSVFGQEVYISAEIRYLIDKENDTFNRIDDIGGITLYLRGIDASNAHVNGGGFNIEKYDTSARISQTAQFSFIVEEYPYEADGDIDVVKENEDDYFLIWKVETYAINITMNDFEDDAADNSTGCTVVDVHPDDLNPDGTLKDDTFQDIDYDIKLTGVIKTIISKEEIIVTYDKDNQDYKVLIDVPKGGPELYEGVRTKVNGWYSDDVDENGNPIILSEGGLIRIFE